MVDDDDDDIIKVLNIFKISLMSCYYRFLFNLLTIHSINHLFLWFIRQRSITHDQAQEWVNLVSFSNYYLLGSRSDIIFI